MRGSRARIDARRFGLRNSDGGEKSEAEVAAKTKREGTADRLRETQLQNATESIGLHEAALAAEAMEVQRTQRATTILDRRDLANFHYLRQ